MDHEGPLGVVLPHHGRVVPVDTHRLVVFHPLVGHPDDLAPRVPGNGRGLVPPRLGLEIEAVHVAGSLHPQRVVLPDGCLPLPAHLIAPVPAHVHGLVRAHAQHLIVPDLHPLIAPHLERVIPLHHLVEIALRMHVDLLCALLVLEGELVEAPSAR